MKFLVVLAIAVACASADVSHLKDESHASVVRNDYDLSPEGAFRFVYETANGIYAEAAGEVKNPNSEYPSLSVSGGYKYDSPDGSPIQLSYVADEEGYKPVGSHLPVAPEVPEQIKRALAYIAAHPPAPEGVVKAAPAAAYKAASLFG